MAHSILRQTRTQADVLRDLLEDSYALAVNMKGAGPQKASQLLDNLDQIARLLPDLEAAGVDLRSEKVRWQEVQGAVRRHADSLRNELAPLGGLKTLRETLALPPSLQNRWWWWLDVTAFRNMRKRFLVGALVIASVIILLVGGIWTFNKLFPVDPQVSAAYGHKLNAEELVGKGDLSGAITELNAALRLTPDDPDILTMLVALYDLTDQEERVNPIGKKLYAEFPSSIVDSNIAQSYMVVGAVEKALSKSLQAVDEDPKNAQGYLIAGMAYEAKGDTHLAYRYYRQAADVASAAGDHQTEAFAKIRLATLLQKAQVPTQIPDPPDVNGN
ncbi:MAG: hypothetical protein DSY55_01205 [Clostridia bacterium]|nr:MAG: hypothetical protein DSY55_01205 [Clostridia bacterium]